MDGIIQCQCGARIRKPPAGSGAFRCPRCQTVLSDGAAPAPMQQQWAPAQVGAGPIPAEPPNSTWNTPAAHSPVAPPPILPRPVVPLETSMVPETTATQSDAGNTCPTCQTKVRAGDPIIICPSCSQTHHKECWLEIGGCATYGCDKSPALDKSSAPAADPMSAWGDTKSCPVCGEQIKSIAVRCRFCKTDFGTVDPLSARDLHARAAREQSLKSVRGSAVTLFVCSVIGILAPLMMIIGLCWVLPKRKLIAQAGPVYLIMAYSSLGLSVIYSLMMLVFALS